MEPAAVDSLRLPNMAVMIDVNMAFKMPYIDGSSKQTCCYRILSSSDDMWLERGALLESRATTVSLLRYPCVFRRMTNDSQLLPRYFAHLILVFLAE